MKLYAKKSGGLKKKWSLELTITDSPINYGNQMTSHIFIKYIFFKTECFSAVIFYMGLKKKNFLLIPKSLQKKKEKKKKKGLKKKKIETGSFKQKPFATVFLSAWENKWVSSVITWSALLLIFQL